MTLTQQIITVILCMLGTISRRLVPFLIFTEKTPTPPYIQSLGQALPAAIFGMLVIYCVKNVDFLANPHGAPELIAMAVTTGLHLWRRQMLVSIAGGTLCYMYLVQAVFR